MTSLVPTPGQIRDALYQATYALRDNRLRTPLSILGIAVGIIAVIIVGVVTKGVRERVFSELQSYGLQSFWIYRRPTRRAQCCGARRHRY